MFHRLGALPNICTCRERFTTDVTFLARGTEVRNKER